MTNGIAWTVIVGLWWFAGVILWLTTKHRRRQRHATHRELRISGRAHLGSEIDEQTYADAMLRAVRRIFGWLLAFVLFVVGLWLLVANP